jgi:hypothetical protein
LLLCYGLLDHYKKARAYPVNECACWPLVSEWQVKELQHLKERTKPIDEPVLIVFGNASLKKLCQATYSEVEIVQQGGHQGQ